MGTVDTSQKRTDIPHLPIKDFSMSKSIREKFETFLDEIDWSSPKFSRKREYLLYSIKNAQNDEELLNIMCRVFYNGYFMFLEERILGR